MSRIHRSIRRCALAGVLGVAASAHAVPIVFSGSGAGAATAFNDFLAAGATNRIGWDGVRLDGTDASPATRVIVPNGTVEIPVDRFRGVGAIYADPYAVSADGFVSVNPATSGQFLAFSSPNTFAMFDPTPGSFTDRFIEQTFVVPGTDTPGSTRAFGAIFLDTEQAGSSSIEYFGQRSDGTRVSLGAFPVPTGATGEPQFLGVLFDAAIVTDVTLTLGDRALFSVDPATLAFQSFGAEDLQTGIDLVVTDDFLFAPPVARQFIVPEPGSTLLLGAVVALLGWLQRSAASAQP